MKKLDPRLHAYRPDLADENLIGKVAATQFVKGQAAFVQVPVTPILKSSSLNEMQTSQALWGEACIVFERAGGHAWVQMCDDAYVGYVVETAITEGKATPTHHVTVPSTHAYPQANIKSHQPFILPMNAKVEVENFEGEFAHLSNGSHVFAKHLSQIPHLSPVGGRWRAATDEGLSTNFEPDFVSIAEKFLNVPYLWGGKTFAGIDCSGLVQICLQACGIKAPRDSDMQEQELGTSITDHSNLQRGDLIFWPGHVGIMQDHVTLLHANGHAMQVTSEPLAEVMARSTKPITAIKRLATIKP